MPGARARFNVALLLAIIVLGTVAYLGVTGKFPGSLISPSAPIIFNPNPETFTFKSNNQLPGGLIAKWQCNTAPSGITATNPGCYYPQGDFTTSTDTLINTPVGIFNRVWTDGGPTPNSLCTATFGGTCQVWWNVAMPGNLPNGCWTAAYPSTICYPPNPSNYAMTASITGSGFTVVPNGNPDALPQNPYSLQLTYTSKQTITNSTGTYLATTTITRTIYVTRYWFTVNLSAPSGNGASGLFSLQCREVINSFAYYPSGCTYDTPPSDFQQGMSTMLPDLNNAAHLSGTIGLQIQIPLTNCATSNLDWCGAWGAWAGGGISSGMSGDCTTAAGSCSTGLTSHSQLGMYLDPALTQGAFSTANQFPATLLTTQQICSVSNACGQSPSSGNCNSGLPCKFYIAIPIQSFGDTFSNGAACSPLQLSACFVSGGATMPIPITFDVVSSSLPAWVTSYQSITPTGNTAATVTGKVLDGGSILCNAGICPGLAGVTVSDGPPCNAQGCSMISTTTSGDGSYSLGGLTAGGHTIYYSYPGYNTAQNSGVSLSAGQTLPLQTIVMLPASTGNGGPNQLCLINPQPSNVPGVPGTPGVGCQPYWLVAVEIGAIVLFVFFTAFLAIPSGRKIGVSYRGAKGSF